ncbi:DUF1905 domain-containing protein [Pleomorphovibrio marinus]|uniref:DUF1905 domain-containing protein n=1 Tax=Pleomorphovibrio marinus TaxID=2164132 RepID=UPI000E0BB0D0|nr:DUF1905 domain-containing protein [Pleomorphovibrio marinus]
MKVITEGTFILEKFPQKGGWTYVLFPALKKSNAYFGMKKVEVHIDGHELGQMTLMPFGNGLLFLPINAKIRKQIKKESGHEVQITVFAQEAEEGIFGEKVILDCIREEPHAWEKFKALSLEERQTMLDGIIAHSSEEKRIQKIVQLMERLKFR